MAKQSPVEISVERKLVALATKLASAPVSSAQATVLKFAQPVPAAPGIVVMSEGSVAELLNATGVDPMLLARKFMGMEPNSQGLTAQQLYALTPFFWPNSAEGPSGFIACVEQKDGSLIASGLLSALLRAGNGFNDHLVQINGRIVEGVVLAKPNIKTPSIARGVFDKAGANGALATALLTGFGEVSELPSCVVAAGKPSKTAAAEDPFADLDGWL